MTLLDSLELAPTPTGYVFVLDGEALGGCDLDGVRLSRFEVAPDQRRRGIGRRAMALLLETLPPEVRLAVGVPGATSGRGRSQRRWDSGSRPWSTTRRRGRAARRSSFSVR